MDISLSSSPPKQQILEMNDKDQCGELCVSAVQDEKDWQKLPYRMESFGFHVMKKHLGHRTFINIKWKNGLAHKAVFICFSRS
jgi:hypothetical protein